LPVVTVIEKYSHMSCPKIWRVYKHGLIKYIKEPGFKSIRNLTRIQQWTEREIKTFVFSLPKGVS